MCIIQEDKEDWQHEARMMTDVYSNSSLNLAAADSPDGDTGCFFDDRPDYPLAWQIEFPHKGLAPPAEIPDSLTFNCVTKRTRAIITYSRLSSRAWTLQERLLPPRTLYFGRDQIAWECRQGNSYETLPDMFKEGGFRMSPKHFFAILKASPLDDTRNVWSWFAIVEDYTRRKLTLSRDKLVAISGLARQLVSVYGTDYVAGLWVKDLLRLLVWYKSSSYPSAARDVATIYRAPSWSWASVDGLISFPIELLSPAEGEDVARSEDLERPPLAKVLGTFSPMKTSATFYFICFHRLAGSPVQ
jgi:hypothetical protein